MIYISEIIGKEVWDAHGTRVGTCTDVLVGLSDKQFPPVVAIQVRQNSSSIQLINASQIGTLYPGVALNVPQSKISEYEVKGNELYLNKQILDHQIVDVEGRRVVRVNDLQIAFSKNEYVLTGVDVGNLGLLRRLGLEGLYMKVAGMFGKLPEKSVITWNDVVHIEEKDPLRLVKSKEMISRLPPADIAAILEDLDRVSGLSLMENMDNEVLADTLEESPMKTQIEVLSNMDSERAADILEEMEPDEAADLLADLSAEASQNLLELMEEEEAEDIRSLLDHPHDSAGGIMTTDFGWIPEGLTVIQAMEYLRKSEDAQDVEDMYYIYVLDPNEVLRGVIYLRDLVMAEPEMKVDELMNNDPISVLPAAAQDEVAYLIAKYDLLSIPVIEEGTDKMLGIVTLDDAIDTVLPTAYKKRLPRFF
jgi:CBS domain-containing protein/sporulation protein YlmC with PRC-barrel domain